MKLRNLFAAFLALTFISAPVFAQRPGKAQAPVPLVPIEAPAEAEQPESPGVVLGQSSMYTTANNKPQRFMDYVDLSKGDAALPLTLVVSNGTNVAPGFNWIRVSVAGRTLFTQNNVMNTREVPFALSGRIEPGTSQIVVEAGGVRGATMAWKLYGKRVAPVLQSAKPGTAAFGETITLTGLHFGTTPSLNTVKFNNTVVDVKSATDTSLDIVIPETVKPGDNKVTVTYAEAVSNAIKVKIIAVPVLESLDLQSGPPGQELTITGKNFSDKVSENKVFIAGAQAEITNATPTSLTVIIPEVFNPQYSVVVGVEVRGVKSKNYLTMDIYNRVY